MTKRRVSFALAVPIVLGCGAIGAAAGWMFPPHAFRTDGVSELTQPEPNKASTFPSDTIPATERAEVIPQPVASPIPTTEIVEVPQAEPAQPSVTTSEIHAAVKPSVGDGKKQRSRAEERKRQPTREAAATKKKYPDEANEREPRQQSVLSQVPVLGPVFGLLLP
jgi:hypothetical protein